MALQALKDFVPGLVKRIGVTDAGFQVVSLLEREIHKSSPQAQIVAFKNNKIFVEVDSSVQLYELNLRKREILKILGKPSGVELPELRFFLKGTAHPSAQDRLRASRKTWAQNPQERN